jgi:Protein of unknown function (DUF4435)
MNLALTKPTAKEEVDDMRNEAFKDKKTLTIAVEGKDDVAFWSFVFDRSDFRDKYRIFRSYNYPKAESSGKTTLVHYLPHTRRDFAICVDSDYDYLLENTDWQRPFVFQTYTYSIENYYCYVPSLNDVLKRAANLTSNTEGYNFEDIFIRQFSEIIYELVVESLQEAQNTGRVREARSKLGRDIRLSSRRTIEAMLTQLNEHIQSELQHSAITNAFREQLTQKGLTPQTAYLFARGHDVLNSVFEPILKLVEEEMKSRKLLELDAIEDVRLKNDVKKAYRMNVINVKTCLLENRGFTDSFLFQKIENAIREAFQ